MSTASLSPSSVGPRLIRIVRSGIANRTVQLTMFAWIAINGLIASLANGALAIDRPLFEGQSVNEQLAVANLALVEVLALIAIVVLLTRNRDQSQVVTHLQSSSAAGRETLVLVTWGIVAIFGGIALGQAMNTSPIGFHLAGTIFGVHDHDLVTREVALTWAAYNLTVYAVIPSLWFRQRTGTMPLPLRSLCRRGDLVVVLVVLIIEGIMQLSTVSAALLGLDTRQLVIGAPLTFTLYFLGTVLPTTIFVQAMLVPRFFALTRSVPATIVLGGVAYTAVHASDSWMVMSAPEHILVSLGFLVLTYFGPGMIKAVMTVRTGNAWVHAWGYHALAPHTLIDTPLIVRIFGL